VLQILLFCELIIGNFLIGLYCLYFPALFSIPQGWTITLSKWWRDTSNTARRLSHFETNSTVPLYTVITARCWYIILKEFTNVTDTQTDRQTPHDG